MRYHSTIIFIGFVATYVNIDKFDRPIIVCFNLCKTLAFPALFSLFYHVPFLLWISVLPECIASANDCNVCQKGRNAISWGLYLGPHDRYITYDNRHLTSEVGANKLFPFLSLDRYSFVQSYWKGLQVSLELQID